MSSRRQRSGPSPPTAVITAEADFYEFMRALDMARNSIKDGEKTLVVSSDSPIARVFSALS